MNRDSNGYTFLFAASMVLVVASTLAFTASSLKSLQEENVRKEKMQNILSTIGIQTDRDQAERIFKNHISAIGAAYANWGVSKMRLIIVHVCNVLNRDVIGSFIRYVQQCQIVFTLEKLLAVLG